MDVKKEFESTSRKFELNSECDKQSALNSSNEDSEDDYILNTKRLKNFSLKSSKRGRLEKGVERPKMKEDEIKKEIMKNSYNLRKY